jgi:protein SCO1/2
MGGCRQQNSKNLTATTSVVKVYNLRGKVVSVDATAGVVTVDHESIPGFMDAMTMPYKLKDINVAAKLHPGDRITAKVLVGQNEDDISLDEIVIAAQ